MVAIIREADREPVSGVAKRHGISEQARLGPRILAFAPSSVITAAQTS